MTPPRVRRSLHAIREHAILRMRSRLENDGFPRVQMGLIVVLTGLGGLLASFLLLQAGMGSMALRYPAALGLAYLLFLLLLWLWLRTNTEDYGDLPDPGDLLPGNSGGGGTAPSPGGGGDFGGGGASGSFDAPEIAPPTPSNTLGPLGDVAEGAASADELAIPILAIALAIGLALASLYVVYLAPVLFAELLVDGVLSYSLYRHLRGVEAPHWFMTALRRTVLPFCLTGIFLAVVGWAIGVYAPGARTVGQALHSAASAR